MLIDEVENYIGEMARVLKPGAYCWNTYLLPDDVATELVKNLDGKTRWHLPYPIEGGMVRDPANPEAQIALYQDRILSMHEKNGLEIVDIRYGPWSGRLDNVRAGGQDIIIARKKC